MFLIRLPESKWQNESGEPVDLGKASKFETLSEAAAAATKTAKGITEFDEEMRPIKHLSMADVEAEVTEPVMEEEA